MPITTAAALVAAKSILDSVCPDHTPNMLLMSASIIQLSVNKCEAEQKAVVLPFRGRG